MQSLVVFLALAAAASGSLVPGLWNSGLVLDPLGRSLAHGYLNPLAHSVVAPAVVGPTVYAGSSAVTHQSRVDVNSSPTVITDSVAAAPIATTWAASPIVPYSSIWGARSALASPLLVGSGLLGHGHFIKKRSLEHWGPIGYASPILAPSAVSHQSRVDVQSSPSIVTETVAAPVVAHTVAAPWITEAVATPLVAHAIAPSAVSHQSRVDFKSSPAVVTESVEAAPLATPLAASPILPYSSIWGARSALASPFLVGSGLVRHGLVGHGLVGHGLVGHSLVGHGLVGHELIGNGLVAPAHLIKKRSLGLYAPSAVSHQSRVDVQSSPAIVTETVAAPLVARTVAAPWIAEPIATPLIAHGIAPAAVSHQSRVDVSSSPAIISEGLVGSPFVRTGAIASPWYGHGLLGW